jgi:GT2 family glycosyltransferase
VTASTDEPHVTTSLRSGAVTDGSSEQGEPASRIDLIAENERLRLQLAYARQEAFAWRVHVQGIAESRPVIVGRALASAFGRIAPRGSRRRRWSGKAVEGLLWIRRRGRPVPPYETRRYRQYYAHARVGDSQLRSRAATLAFLERHVTVSAVVVAGKGDLSVTLGSLAAQVYDRLEVVVVAPAALEVTAPVRCVAAQGSVSARLNAGIAEATGEYVCCVLAGDVLAHNAIYDLVVGVQDGSAAAYGDEDRTDARGEHESGHLKPSSFGDETLLSYDVVGAPLLALKATVTAVGGYDEATEPAHFHDLSLRIAEVTRPVHVTGVLLSRPQALDPDPFDAAAATVSVVTRAFERRGHHASVEVGTVLPSVRFKVSPPSPAPSVAIVIPTRDRLDLLKACVESVTTRSTYPNYSIVICDNDSVEEETLAWLKASGHLVVPCPGPFNYASIVNKGVAHTDADFVLTLNNDTTIATVDWLEQLVGLCSLDGVGSVGVKLQYPDGRLQHEGVGIIPMPVHLSRDANYTAVDRWLTSTRDAAAVTGACAIVRTEAWRALGGLDERLAVAFNDVDFCLRLGAAGWRVVYTPDVVLGHRESASRGDLHPPADEALLVARWDLHGAFTDPSMPTVVRQYTTKAELDIPAPGR